LIGTNFEDAVLRDAMLPGAGIRDACFQGADLQCISGFEQLDVDSIRVVCDTAGGVLNGAEALDWLRLRSVGKA